MKKRGGCIKITFDTPSLLYFQTIMNYAFI